MGVARKRVPSHLRAVAGTLGITCLLGLVLAALTLPAAGGYVSNLSARLLQPSLTHPLGTDELGRDLSSRFITGTRYTVLTALMTTFLAGGLGWLIALASAMAPTWFARLIAILARICFIAPSLLLMPRWPGRLLMTALCIVPVLPLFILSLFLIIAGGLTGVAASFVLGPLFAVGIADRLSRADHRSTPIADATDKRSFRQLISITAPVFAWSAYFQATLDIFGLGVQPPQPSWGTILDSQSISLLPQVAAGLSFLMIGLTAFTFHDVIAPRETRH